MFLLLTLIDIIVHVSWKAAAIVVIIELEVEQASVSRLHHDIRLSMTGTHPVVVAPLFLHYCHILYRVRVVILCIEIVACQAYPHSL